MVICGCSPQKRSSGAVPGAAHVNARVSILAYDNKTQFRRMLFAQLRQGSWSIMRLPMCYQPALRGVRSCD